MWLIIAALVVAANSPAQVSGEDNRLSVVVNPKNVINYISKEFVCFSAKPRNVFENSLNPISEKSFLMAKNLGPMFLKVYGDSSQLELQIESRNDRSGDSDLIQITPNGWRAFNEWAQQAGVIPIFVLDYEQANWKPTGALKVLTVAKKLGVQNCLWQLGHDNITNAVKYVEDLRAFQAIVKAFNFWGVVANDIDPSKAGIEETRYFNLNVDDVADAITVNYEPSTDEHRLQHFVLQRESYLRGPSRSQLPVWLDVKLPTTITPENSCDLTCLREGLQYATLLGDAARNGFEAVFKQITRAEVQAYSLSYLIALLHKNSIGTKVFDVPQTRNSENVQIYAYCSDNSNGSLTLMAVNHLTEDILIGTKLITKQPSAEIQQFIISASNGQILLNGEPFDFDASLEPVYKIQPVLKDFQLQLPALAIAFWIFPNLNLRECSEDYQELRTKFSRSISEQETAVEQLLQELIAERVTQDITQLSRRKRSTTTTNDGNIEDILINKLSRKLRKRKAQKSARKPRQTPNYRRRQRAVRKKEKRMERRNLKKQKHPLRERGKRRINRLAPNKFTSKKTKRSFLAEAMDQVPMFEPSQNPVEEMNRSGFPQGDVHLVISKEPSEDYVSIEEATVRNSQIKKSRRKKLSSKSEPSEQHLRFVVSTDEKPDSGDYGNSPRRLDVDRELIEVRDIKVIEPSAVTASQAEQGALDNKHDKRSTMNDTSIIVEPIRVFSMEQQKGDSPTGHSELNLSMLPQSEEAAHVEQLNRRKRSVDSTEIERLETFVVNNTKLQQKFTEMFDTLLKSFKCPNGSAETEVEEKKERTKRDAQLHSQSWDSSEQSNTIAQRGASAESSENMIPTGQGKKVKSTNKVDSNHQDTSDSSDNGDRPAVTMLRSVTNFIKGMTTQFHRIFNNLFPRTPTA
ncbi:uncharacterized protein LOC129779970 [Toxorhynchites rutilus septentrionalis]|uniref:uncharacterized protein LOC129779970 n=1 Tax=Toxorhynchites rutilus septentrionalis TaxID=329112 RepID=UPI002479A864|nr:uncharacterized protein LOC129779970 [Toxorhynchites rutilus septentrionalis]